MAGYRFRCAGAQSVNVSDPCFRPAAAECVQQQCVGNPTHTAGDVQLSSPSHPASLPGPAPQSSPLSRLRTADQPEPAASVVSTTWHLACGWYNNKKIKKLK